MASEDTRNAYKCCRGCCGVLVLVMLILILSARHVIRFHELAFEKPFLQEINQEVVYEEGVHYLLFSEMVKFPAQVIDADLYDLSVFSKAEDVNNDDDEGVAGTSLVIDVAIQYQLQPEGLSDIFDIGGTDGYVSQIVAVATDAIKNNATTFSADEYLTHRRIIEKTFTKLVSDELADKFAGTELLNLNLLSVDFPFTFYQRKLQVGIQNLNNQIQEFNRETEVIRDQTLRNVTVIENDAQEIVNVANTEAELIQKRASNEALNITGQAAEESIRLLADELEVTSQKDFLSLHYLVNMLDKPGQQRKFVNFGDLNAFTNTQP